ncbi:hypothetical protein ADL00_23620 [Streptomyces sp. AS58]|uniref:hypothetical protein n=1 Tax=Streptomyces sp. AS58 TaxID=1519489 RepID=UPI0006AE0B89|nr:hypothetical protein [Streptomyces sp. AS58]KOV62949.1 hypothetical protein ADL00_23620 [Streptomyces sp. AS58]
MTDQHPGTGDGVRSAAAHLVAAFTHLGAEHKALSAEQERPAVKDIKSTVRRMTGEIGETSRILAHATTALATVQGMRSLGIDGQMARDETGAPYSPLVSLADPDEQLYEALSLVQAAARHLGSAYTPTRKHPDLAGVRRPAQMQTVLARMRDAVTVLSAELTARGRGEPTEFAECVSFLENLAARTCTSLPAQAGPSAQEVTAAILADPGIARAAAAALQNVPT